MTISISWEAGNDATTTDFAPNNPADWSPVPSDVQNALDQLASSLAGLTGAFVFKGNWDANANNPTLQSGVGTQGDVYFVSVAGTTNLDGITDWQIGDFAVFNGTVWQKWDNTDLVTSVNGKTGAVVLVSADITDTVTKPASSTDNALARYDGVTGKLLQNSPVTLSDSGDFINSGTSGIFKTEDKTGATASVAISIESGATVDGNSGDASLKAGVPSGTGTRGDANIEGKNVNITLDGEDDLLTIKSGAETIGTLQDASAQDSLLIWYFGTTANPNVNMVLQGKGASANSLIHFWQDSTEYGQIGYFDPNDQMVIDSRQDKSLEILTGVNVSGGVATGGLSIHTGDANSANSGVLDIYTGDTVTSGNSGQLNIYTGTAAGTRGPITLTSSNITLGVGDILSGSNTGDEVQATESVAGIAELATQAETDAGTDDLRMVTPLKLRTTPEYLRSTAVAATPYNALVTDDTITVNVAGASIVNLPSAASVSGKVITVKRYSAAGPNVVTVTPAGGDTIDNAANFPLNSLNASVTVQSDGGTNWIVI